MADAAAPLEGIGLAKGSGLADGTPGVPPVAITPHAFSGGQRTDALGAIQFFHIRTSRREARGRPRRRVVLGGPAVRSRLADVWTLGVTRLTDLLVKVHADAFWPDSGGEAGQGSGTENQISGLDIWVTGVVRARSPECLISGWLRNTQAKTCRKLSGCVATTFSTLGDRRAAFRCNRERRGESEEVEPLGGFH